jgi:hypothetical protein
MPNNFANEVIIEEIEDESGLGIDDFNIVIGPDGELKSFSIPEHLMDDPPEEVAYILQMYGIDDLNTIGNRTLH